MILKQIETELNKKVSLKEIYKYKNIAEISDYLQTIKESDSEIDDTKEVKENKSIDDLFN